MKGDTMFKVKFGIFIAIFVLFVAGIAVAQQDTTDVYTQPREGEFDINTYETDAITTEPWTNDLRDRLNLTEDQVSEVNDIITRYQRESTEVQGTETMGTRTEVQNRYSTEIESILDENQRIQWREYSTTWWDNVNNNSFEENRYDNQGTEDQNWDNQRESDIERDRTVDPDYDTETDSDTETDTEVR
jgi:hypothetical protein